MTSNNTIIYIVCYSKKKMLKVRAVGTKRYDIPPRPVR